jgi:hypothetical protein
LPAPFLQQEPQPIEAQLILSLWKIIPVLNSATGVGDERWFGGFIGVCGTSRNPHIL